MSGPVARLFARQSQASDERVRADLERLPSLLDQVDSLIAEGTIGGDPPNAADLQIGSSVRALACLEQLAPLIRERPAGELAQRLFPDYPVIPSCLPRDWLPG
jgi:glutathione S-transferase